MSAGQLWRGVLTEKQAEVAEHVAKGLSDVEIALEMCCQASTVKHHMGASFTKLGLKNRTQLAVWWTENVVMPHPLPQGWEGSD